MARIEIDGTQANRFWEMVFEGQVEQRLGIPGKSDGVTENQANVALDGGFAALRKAAARSGDVGAIDGGDLFDVQPKKSFIEKLGLTNNNARANAAVLDAAEWVENVALMSWQVQHEGKSSFNFAQIGLAVGQMYESVNAALESKVLGRADREPLQKLYDQLVRFHKFTAGVEATNRANGAPILENAKKSIAILLQASTARENAKAKAAGQLRANLKSVGMDWAGDATVFVNGSPSHGNGVPINAALSFNVQTYPRTNGVSVSVCWVDPEGEVRRCPMKVASESAGRYRNNILWSGVLDAATDQKGTVRVWVEATTGATEPVKILPEVDVKIGQ